MERCGGHLEDHLFSGHILYNMTSSSTSGSFPAIEYAVFDMDGLLSGFDSETRSADSRILLTIKCERFVELDSLARCI